MKRSVEMFFPAKKTILCILAALLLTALAYAVVSPKAYAAEAIKEVYVNYDTSKVKLDASMTGREANDIFKQNRSVGEQSKDKCKLDYAYSFLARLEPGSEFPTGYGSNGQILRKRLAENDDLLSADRKYFLVFNLIQKEGYEFPHNSNKDAKLDVKVYANGKLRTDAQVDRYNTDSVDVYVPIECSSNVVVKSIVIDPAEITMKKGDSRQLDYKVIGTQGIALKWTMSGSKSSGTKVDFAGKVTVSSSEPRGSKLTVKATSVDVPSVYGTCVVNVDDIEPYINGISVVGPDPSKGQNAVVDVKDGSTKTVHFSVSMTGTGDRDFDVSLGNAHCKGTSISNITREGFDLTVNGQEPDGTLWITVTSKINPSVEMLCQVRVKGIPRINLIDLSIDTTHLYYDKNGGQPASDLYKYITFDYLQSVRSDTYIDFNRSTDIGLLYTYLVERTSSGWDEKNFKRVQTSETLEKDKEYFLKLNIDNYEKSNNKSLWPDDLSKINVTVNGVSIGAADSTGTWYSKTETGSIIVFVALGEKSSTKYSIVKYAPGIKVVTLEGLAEPTLRNSFYWGVIPRYKDQIMHYDFGKRVWCYLSFTEDSTLKYSDFAFPTTTMRDQFTSRYEIAGSRGETYEERGDVNGSGRINAVDAQIIYDVSCGRYNSIDQLATYKSFPVTTGLRGEKALFFCDVNNDDFVDSADAFATQRRALVGSWGK